MISREELYELVWSKPMTQLGRQFEVPGSYIARVFTILNVPERYRPLYGNAAVFRDDE